MAPPKKTVGRGGGSSFAPLATPLAPEVDPSEPQQGHRIDAFLCRLGLPAGVHREHARRILRDVGWELDAAVALWDIELEDIRRAHDRNVPGRSEAQQARDRLLSARSIHQNHRRAIDQLYLNIQATDLSITSRRLTTLRLALLLREHNWDLAHAQEAYLDRESNSTSTTLADMNRRERRLRMTPDNHSEPTLLHRDERLAIFLDFAGTDDWVSLRDHLANHKWDLGKAVDAWMTAGVRKTQPTKAEEKRGTYWQPRLAHVEADLLWPAGRPLAGPVAEIDVADESDAVCDYGDEGYEDRLGWMFLYDQPRARAGMPVEQKMTQFAIRGGYGVIYEWEGAKKGDGTKWRKGTPEDMDWLSTLHVSQLNRWRDQQPARVEKVKKKDRSQPFHQDELRWIYDWHKAIAAEILASDPDVNSNGGTWPIKFDLKQLTSDFNTRFKGDKTLSGTDSKPRQQRTVASLDQRRKRIWECHKDFGLQWSPAHGDGSKVATLIDEADRFKPPPAKNDEGNEADEEEQASHDDEAGDDEEASQVQEDAQD